MSSISEKLGIKKIITEKTEHDNKKIYVVENDSFKAHLTFDCIYTSWINNLCNLLNHIEDVRKKRKINSPSMIDKNGRDIDGFYYLSESVLCQLLYSLTKDELSQSENNLYLDHLVFNIVLDEYTNNNQLKYTDYLSFEDSEFDKRYEQIRKIISSLYCEHFNEIISGIFFDFYVSYWSLFESCINFIVSPYNKKIQISANDSETKKVRIFLNKLCSEDSSINTDSLLKCFDNNKELFLKKFAKYVSFNDKINYLFKHVLIDYSRDKKNDRKIIEFCAAKRNTIHNNGLHLKRDQNICIKGKTFSLNNNDYSKVDSYSELFIIAEELFDIYDAIVCSYKTSIPQPKQ